MSAGEIEVRNFGDLSIYPLSEKAVTVEYGNEISEEVLDRISRFHKLLLLTPFPGMTGCVPAYCTLTVFYDPVEVYLSDNLVGTSCFVKVSTYLNELIDHGISPERTVGDTVHIPVCYGGEFGPDLMDVARMHQLTPEEVIQLHISVTYRVYMIGFVPGFAYLGGLPVSLHTPRKLVPRQRVPGGSVGLAGMQTGIYPMETPGGWQLIGRTPANLFDALRPCPSLLQAGDKVAFYEINAEDFYG